MFTKSNKSISAIVELVAVANAIKDLANELENAKEKALPKAFIVKVDDPRGMYLQSMVNTVEEYIDMKNLNKIKEGDYIIFANNDVRLEKDSFKALEATMLNDLEQLFLVSDYRKVEDSINNYFKKVYKTKAKVSTICCGCPFASICVHTLAPVAKKEVRIYDGEWVNSEEKVSIWTKFVKIGYRTYNIRFNEYTYDTVRIGGDTFEIRTGNNGKYLLKA